MKSKLLGRKVDITDKDSIYYGEWGTIIGCDEDNYYIAIADGKESVPVFNREQFVVRKKKPTNTRIIYQYTDAWNYKNVISLVLKGKIDNEMINKIKRSLTEDGYFIPSQVGLPEERCEKLLDFEADHAWFEFVSAELVTETSTFNESIEDLVNKFDKINGNWNELEWFKNAFEY